MIENIEALLRGYVMFRVNSEFFWLYTSAQDRRKEITEGPLDFSGFNFWYNLFSKYGAWRGFYARGYYTS